ncbi:MAG: 1-phosphofructokinase family hexose kinase [Proteobacteria bacterium]|nr:1-phosphofructokinase family hexose kinase [Pseudomonadota bacterium]
MIYTITLSPSLDRIVDVEELIYDDVNKIEEERRRAGGRGIDVSRVIRELGGQSIALGLIGGYDGLELEGRLINEGVICDFTRINSETRTNNIVYQRKKKLQTLLSTCEPDVDPLEIASFFNKIKEIPRRSYVVISGNMPKGVNENFYAQMIITLKEKGAKVILDTDGEALRRGVDAGPCLIKPNIHEFGRFVEHNVSSVEEIINYAKPYQNVVEYIVVSMGVRGVVGINRNEYYLATPPKIKVRSSIGAGDSLVAGIVYAMSEGRTFEDAITLGVACGTASTLNSGNELCKREDVEIIKKDVIIKKI